MNNSVCRNHTIVTSHIYILFFFFAGTPLLPPHLDFFNYSRYDNSLTNGRNGRDSSPSSSSTSLSNVTEDHTFTPVSACIVPVQCTTLNNSCIHVHVIKKLFPSLSLLFKENVNNFNLQYSEVTICYEYNSLRS